jgi:hypothetical protein
MMKLSEGKYLLDVNALVALLEKDHVHHPVAQSWFNAEARDWGVCALTEAGFLRVATHPKAGAHTMEAATAILADLASRPGYRFWPITNGWATLTVPFSRRLFGHQQVTDAFLLGLAIKEDGILVTFDKAIVPLAATECRRNVLLLE